jgi:hypothetical protein
LLAVKIEDDREEAVPLTQPQSKERIEVMRRATTHTKKFLATKGEHVMTDDFFVSAQTNINEFDIEQLTMENEEAAQGNGGGRGGASCVGEEELCHPNLRIRLLK